MATTAHHIKYYAYDLTRQAPPGGADQLSMSLFDASVDLNPHQIEAAMFALQSPLSEGVVLADEVGLGKTIEAGIVLCQRWAERRRRLLVICPAAIRKQWATELQEKFNLPAVVMDSHTYRQFQQQDQPRPFEQRAVMLVSYHYAARMQDDLRMVPWDLVIIDEAHKLRNAYRPSNKVGQAIRWATEGRRKLLLTATPLQNSLMELYGLASLIDDHIFGDPNAFRSQYVNAGGDLAGLRQRLAGFCKRTLRQEVLEYVRYTERRALTQPFRPTDAEQRLYDRISEFLQRENTYAIPDRQRHLIVLILRKLLASSSSAIAGNLESLRDRLIDLRDSEQLKLDWSSQLVESEEMDTELLDEWLSLDENGVADGEAKATRPEPKKLRDEISEIDSLAKAARAIGVDAKSRALLTALDVAFREMVEMGAREKALIFTESRRTQDYLKAYLEQNGYTGQVLLFNGTNAGPEAKAIYESWVSKNQESGRATGSRAIDVRLALVEHFRDNAKIMIATEAAAEGVNLQFCSLVINYDLPWNPQRIEQRIGRCHRYGQQHDVIVVNFLNERNEADQRVHELLTDKFNLFNGLFGASDEILGQLESGVDFEKRILTIYQQCRTSDEIEAAFRQLQEELDEQIKGRIEETRQALLEHFDEDVHARLRLRLEDAQAQLDRIGQRFWQVTEHVLDGRARFDEASLAFDLHDPPKADIRPGSYHLISKTRSGEKGEMPDYGYYLYRLSHPLGEHVIESAKQQPTPTAHLRFNITTHPGRIALVEALKGKSGWLILAQLTIESFETEEYLLFSGIDDDGRSLDNETCAKLFNVAAENLGPVDLPAKLEERLGDELAQHQRATANRSLEANNQHFNAARERLEQWAEDKMLAAEKSLKDTKEQIKALRRQGRQAETLEEQHEIQERLKQLEQRQRKQRRDIFRVEDEIEEQRDSLITALEKRLARDQQCERLFTLRWSVV
ncbi:SNF2-related protein [Thioalkalivibrio sp. ALE23]|uniref:SNF2-related protein n=1 Tax=Thioalkalivibrio sp. ALE23 TaxID=1265495 RepID=UPI0003794F3F|nr:SNF2-related protein [Thioalkalivibrio sp. ALE23]